MRRKFKRGKRTQQKSPEPEHLYGEAYMLMSYECSDCGKVERIWNSRNGVTPFMIGCRFCDGAAQHRNWNQDVFSLFYKPQPGERIFAGKPEAPKIVIVS